MDPDRRSALARSLALGLCLEWRLGLGLGLAGAREADAASAASPQLVGDDWVLGLALMRCFDGDSFLAVQQQSDRRRGYSVRLVGLDAPEKDQAYGPTATEALHQLLVSGMDLQLFGRDSFQRWLALARVAGQDVGLEMIARGHAWFFRRYASSLPSELARQYAQAEAHARRGRLGLWSHPAPQPPWRHRAQQSQARRVRDQP